jgi:hypothetical protein
MTFWAKPDANQDSAEVQQKHNQLCQHLQNFETEKVIGQRLQAGINGN